MFIGGAGGAIGEAPAVGCACIGNWPLSGGWNCIACEGKACGIGDGCKLPANEDGEKDWSENDGVPTPGS